MCGYGPRGMFLRKLGTVGVTCIFFVLALSRSGLVVRLDDNNTNGHGNNRNRSNNNNNNNRNNLLHRHQRQNQELLEFQRQDELLLHEQQQQQLQRTGVETGTEMISETTTAGGVEEGVEEKKVNTGEENDQGFEQQLQQQQQQQRSIENDLNSFVVDSNSGSHVGDGDGYGDGDIGDGTASDGDTKTKIERESETETVSIRTTGDEQNGEESIPSLSFPVSETVDGGEVDDNPNEVETAADAAAAEVEAVEVIEVSPRSVEIEDVTTTDTTADTVEEQENAGADSDTDTDTDNVASNRPLVCSHQLLNPPPRPVKRKQEEDKNENDYVDSDGMGNSTGIVPDGSLEAMTLFWEDANITCYDIDVVVLKDGSLLASHPNRLRAALIKSTSTSTTPDVETPPSNYTTTTTRRNSTAASTAGAKLKTSKMLFDDDDTFNRYIRKVTLAELRTIGISCDSFPLLDADILPHFSKLLRRSDNSEEEMDGGSGSSGAPGGGGDGASGQDSKTLGGVNDPSDINPPESKNEHDDGSETVNTVDMQDGEEHKELDGNVTAKTALKHRSLSSLKKKKRRKSHGRRMLLEESHAARNYTAVVDKRITNDDGIKNAPSRSKATLSGPHINLDLKQGPYLTKDVLKRVVDKIYDLQLEDHVAICVTPLDDEKYTDDESSRKEGMNGDSVTTDPSKPKKEVPLDMLRILVSDDEGFYPSEERNQTVTEDATKKHNLRGRSSRNSNSTINHDRMTPSRTRRSRPMLGLVLRDLVVEDRDVERIHRLVEKYPESIRLLVPSFKFQESWYKQLREYGVGLPMTAWTIDSNEDFEYAARTNVSAVIANNPFDFIPGKV